MENAEAKDPLLGVQVGNYTVKAKLGEGGMGSVYMAEHPLIGKKVALKVLHAEFSSNEDVVGRFFNEAKAVNDIQHPNIVDIIDYGRLDSQAGGRGQMVYFIMEFLNGYSLADLIAKEAPLSPERAIRISMQIADALAASHRSNIVHRDLKPDNVVLVKRRHEEDFVKVLDFGIAKLTGDQPGSRRTRTGIVMGTPAYMSPEQCEGKGDIDHRTDVYALGVVFYELLTGRVPFEGEGYGEVLVKHLTQVPVPPTTHRGVIPPHVEQICLKALEKGKDGRFPTMDAFLQALADPVTYVEGHGGIPSFIGTNLGSAEISDQPLAVAPLATPAPGSLTPPPGLVQPDSSQTEDDDDFAPPAKSKTPLLIGAVVGLAALAGVAVMMGSGGNSKPPETIAAQQAPAATPPPAAPEEKQVTITFQVRPLGAEVFINGEDKAHAKVMIADGIPLKFDKSDESLSYAIKAPGFKDREGSVSLSSDSIVNFELSKAAPAVEKKAEPRKKHRSSRKKKRSSSKKPAVKKKRVRSKVKDNTLAPDLDF